MSLTLKATVLILSASALFNLINAAVPEQLLKSSDADSKAGSHAATKLDTILSSHLDSGVDDDSSMGQADTDSLVDEEANAGDPSSKRAMGMLRLGRAGSRQSSDHRRAMSALRLGRRGDEWKPSVTDSAEAMETEKDKRKSMSMLRLGRGGYNQQNEAAAMKEEEKRAKMSALRLGRKRRTNSGNHSEDDDVSDATPQMSLDMDESEADGDVKRAMGMLRLGRNYENDEGRLEDILTSANDDQKRAMGMLRLGRHMANSPQRVDRRKSMSMLRLG